MITHGKEYKLKKKKKTIFFSIFWWWINHSDKQTLFYHTFIIHNWNKCRWNNRDWMLCKANISTLSIWREFAKFTLSFALLVDYVSGLNYPSCLCSFYPIYMCHKCLVQIYRFNHTRKVNNFFGIKHMATINIKDLSCQS